MFYFVRQYGFVVDVFGKPYRPRAYGQERPDGTWAGWLVFFPMDSSPVVAADQETTQSTFGALSYWASGISTPYLEGALDRALRLRPGPQLATELEQLERIEQEALDQAETLEIAAAAARRASAAAAERRADIVDELEEEAVEEAFYDASAASARVEALLVEEAVREYKSIAAASEKAHAEAAASSHDQAARHARAEAAAAGRRAKTRTSRDVTKRVRQRAKPRNR
jgi:hypothetical protein